MSTHNTHYATKQDKVVPSSGLTFFAICYTLSDDLIKWLTKVVPSSGLTFFAICYTLSDDLIKWLTRDSKLTCLCSSAARFSSFEDAKSFASLDFSNGDSEIVVFCWSTTSQCYFSSHSYTCLGGRSEWCAGRFEV